MNCKFFEETNSQTYSFINSNVKDKTSICINMCLKIHFKITESCTKVTTNHNNNDD